MSLITSAKGIMLSCKKNNKTAKETAEVLKTIFKEKDFSSRVNFYY